MLFQAIWPYSGHYRPSEQNLNNFINFLVENGVDRCGVQINSSSNEDYYEDKANVPVEHQEDNFVSSEEKIHVPKTVSPRQLQIPTEMVNKLLIETTVPTEEDAMQGLSGSVMRSLSRTLSGGLQSPMSDVPPKAILHRIMSKEKTRSYQLGHQLPSPWSTGAGPRIGCVNDYPLELRVQALEFVNLSPKVPPTPSSCRRIPFSPSSIVSMS